MQILETKQEDGCDSYSFSMTWTGFRTNTDEKIYVFENLRQALQEIAVGDRPESLSPLGLLLKI
jgi:hypothetical protein